MLTSLINVSYPVSFHPISHNPKPLITKLFYEYRYKLRTLL